MNNNETNDNNNNNNQEKQELDCSVCLNPILPNQEYCKLICNHVFHPLCVQPWFCTSKSCPNCRLGNNTCQHPHDSPIHLGTYLFEENSLLREEIKKLKSEKLANEFPRQGNINSTNLFEEMLNYQLNSVFQENKNENEFNEENNNDDDDQLDQAEEEKNDDDDDDVDNRNTNVLHQLNEKVNCIPFIQSLNIPRHEISYSRFKLIPFSHSNVRF